MTPQVSIGIPAYNAAGYLEAAIKSALGQSFEDLEIFVCDNRSNDATGAMCAAIKDPRFRYLRFEDHVGQPGNWNRCVRESRGEFIVLLHADDLLEKAFVEQALKALMAAPKAAFVHSAVRHIAQDGRFLVLQRLYETDHETPGREFFSRLLEEGCIVSPAGMMVRRDAYDAVGTFYEEVAWSTDWDMWLRLSLHGPVLSLAEPLASYREHGSSGTAAVVASGRNGSDELKVIDHVLEILRAKGEDTSVLRQEAVRRAAHRTWCWAEEACRSGHSRAARRGILKAVTMDARLLGGAHVWALFLASFLGYAEFQRWQRWRQALGR